MLLSSTLLALALATPDAAAATETKVRSGRIIQNTTTNAGDIVVVTSGDATGTIADVSAAITSGSGTETIRLTEADAWLHGAASLAALPATDARVALTVYDTSSAALVTFTGTLGADGVVSRMKRADYCGMGDTYTCAADLDVLAATTYPEADGTYTVAFDLSGADTTGVAYADLAVVETTACVSRGCTGDVTTTITTAELGFDDLGLVWQGEVSLALDGVSDVTITATDAAGAALDSIRTQVVRAWDDGGAGVSALPTDEDPLTSVALIMDQLHNGGTEGFALTVLSDGWALDDTLPTYAEITLTNGEVWDVPANSYQLATSTPITFRGDPSTERFYLTVNGVKVGAGQAMGRRGICQYGACFSLAQDTGGAWTLSATAYAATPEKLPTRVTVTLSGAYGYATPSESSYTLTFGEEVAVVFATEVSFAGDPSGYDLTGRVRLRGKQTLLVGKFEGQFGVDSDGATDLGFIGSGGATVSKGDILIGGEPIDFELTDTNGDGVISAPPVVVFRTTQGGYGNGYMPPSGQGQTQQTQLL
ncbi:MAG: hypothetical protein Q8P41_11710 [Pseudomonadota bacterium]|nr:hypothetical protein [Pseudomonadota bacterium]